MTRNAQPIDLEFAGGEARDADEPSDFGADVALSTDIPPLPPSSGRLPQGDGANAADCDAAGWLARWRGPADRLRAALARSGPSAARHLRRGACRLSAPVPALAPALAPELARVRVPVAERWRRAGTDALARGSRAAALIGETLAKQGRRSLALSGPDLAEHWLATARRVPAGAAVAAGVGASTLALALFAGDGEGEYPGPAFERALQSHAPGASAVAAETSAIDVVLPGDVFAQKLVEDPVFDPPPGAGGKAAPVARGSNRGGVPAEETAMARAEPKPGSRAGAGAGGEMASAPDRRVLPAPPLVAPGTAAIDAPAASAPPSRAETVLAAATPVPRTGRPPGAAVSDNGISIQLVAVRERDQAVMAWSRLRGANVDVFSGLQPLIVEPTAGLSSFYRLRAGPFGSAEQARARCATLSERRIDCIVVGNGG